MLSKATKERQYRQRELQRKRFDIPLRKFLEIKYPKVYGEYHELYEMLNRYNPYMRNLTKSHTFKIWKEGLNQQSAPDILTSVIKETFQQDEAEEDGTDTEQNTETGGQDETSTDQNAEQTYETDSQTTDQDETATVQNTEQTYEADGQDETTTNNHGELLFKVKDETIEAAPVLVSVDELVDIMSNVEERVDDIVNQLMEEQTVRDILAEPEDEGIELNALDDIDIDLEPFDFNLEVENYNW